MKIRPAVRADFEALGTFLPFRVKAIAAENDAGKVIAIGGVGTMPDGSKVGFAELTDEARSNKAGLHRAAVRLMAQIKADGVKEMMAIADLEESPAAERWLQRLGFERTDGVWLWRSDNCQD